MLEENLPLSYCHCVSITLSVSFMLQKLHIGVYRQKDFFNVSTWKKWYEFLSKVNFLEKGFHLKYNILIIVWYHFFVTIPTLFLPTSLHTSFLWKKWISKHLHIVSDSFFSLNFEVTDLKPNQPQPIATHFSFLFLN